MGKEATQAADLARAVSARSTTGPGASTPAAAGSDATTRLIYRMLEVRGLTSDEASRLTAFLFGLPTTDLRWSLQQINRLLFLRQLRESGAFEQAR